MLIDKKCAKCLERKPLEEFPYYNRNKSQRCSYCKLCKNTYLKEHYAKNDGRKNAIKNRNARVVAENASKIDEFLSTHPCVDCGEKDPVVLEFDHVSGEKKFAISARRWSPTKWDTIQEEIAKCEVRCANCHRRKTAQRKKNLQVSNSMVE